MRYRLGSIIPKSEVLKRYRDEDGEFFLEVSGYDDVLFRVTTGDQVYYKIDKDKMVDEELTLVVDYTKIKQEPTEIPGWESPKAPPKPRAGRHDSLGLESFEFPAPIGGSDHAPDVPQQPEEFTQLTEGQAVPEQIRYRCEANDYGGFTLRYNKFLYMLDSDYRVEIKSPDSAMSYDLTPDPEFLNGINIPDPEEEPFTLVDEIEPKPAVDIELEKGDLLPSHLRPLCEAEIGANYGSRIIISGYLYFLDSQFTVTQKMKIATVEEKKTGPVPVVTGDAPAAGDKSAAPAKAAASPDEPPVKEGVKSVIKAFLIALNKYGVSADYFKDSVFGASNRENLYRAYEGDLSQLNDDLRDAASQGKNVQLDKDECGFNLFKAVALHELYIKSTLSGRGDNMKYLVSFIIAWHPDETMAPLDEEVPLEDQEALMDFFLKQTGMYGDRAETFQRVSRQIRQSIFDEYKELWLNKENVLFKGLAIVKFYEYTTRLDRGDGLSMIRLCRDLMAY